MLTILPYANLTIAIASFLTPHLLSQYFASSFQCFKERGLAKCWKR